MYNLSKPCFCGGHIPTTPIFIFLIGCCWILFFALYCYCTVHRVMPPMHNGEVSSQADIGRRLLAETDNWYELPLNPHVSAPYWEITNKQSTTCEQQRTITPTTAQLKNLFPIGERTVLINIWYWLVTASETQIYRGSFLKYECFPQQFSRQTSQGP